MAGAVANADPQSGPGEPRPLPRRRDVVLLMLARVARAFGFGFSAVLIAVYLQDRGLSSPQIGIVLSVGLAAASLTGLVAAPAAARYGRRLTLAVIGGLMALCGLDLAFATSPWLLALAGATGMLGVGSTDLGPFLAVEQAVLAQAAPDSGRNRAFARYSLTGGLAAAAGGFAAAAAGDARRMLLFFIGFACLGAITAAVPVALSSNVEGVTSGPVFGSIRPLVGLSALFGLDSLGNGLVVNAVVVYWLHIRFGASPAVLGPAFAVMSLLGAGSFELAGRLADRIGLVNTMVFTHLPSNLLLFLMPFAPSLPVALGILLVRSTVVQMDQPARQAYIVSIVKPSERSGALAITGAVRGVANGVGPAVTGVAIQAAALGLPFFIGGGLKCLYDAGLFFGFRSRRGDHEAGALP